MCIRDRLEPLHGELKVSADGLFSCGWTAAALLRALDSHFCAAALRDGAGEHAFPTLVSEKTLERSGYIASFPGCTSRVDAAGRSEKYFLSPAVCYHAYELLAGSQLDGSTVMTCAGRCFRDDPADGRHLWEFTVREVVFLGSSEFVSAQRQQWLELATRWARALGLEASPELASDPFRLREVFAMSCAEGTLAQTGPKGFTPVEKLFEGADLYGRRDEPPALITEPLQFALRPCVRVRTEAGHKLICERDHWLRLRDGDLVAARESFGRSILTRDGASEVISVRSVGVRRVVMIQTEPEQAYDTNGILS